MESLRADCGSGRRSQGSAAEFELEASTTTDRSSNHSDVDNPADRLESPLRRNPVLPRRLRLRQRPVQLLIPSPSSSSSGASIVTVFHDSPPQAPPTPRLAHGEYIEDSQGPWNSSPLFSPVSSHNFAHISLAI
jgi:hypothetical protein